eukprot:TRINITY_DN6707_c0_g1_i1.p1 TRINITY_DN6707_c0_g1~~TRINITY_DN6707_c0_g1_i1.p1  ORF type:complete len:850 (-),score=156.89 TRINITY_DN6707_c0_g1_i1:95-2617(-)
MTSRHRRGSTSSSSSSSSSSTSSTAFSKSTFSSSLSPAHQLSRILLLGIGLVLCVILVSYVFIANDDSVVITESSQVLLFQGDHSSLAHNGDKKGGDGDGGDDGGLDFSKLQEQPRRNRFGILSFKDRKKSSAAATKTEKEGIGIFKGRKSNAFGGVFLRNRDPSKATASHVQETSDHPTSVDEQLSKVETAAGEEEGNKSPPKFLFPSLDEIQALVVQQMKEKQKHKEQGISLKDPKPEKEIPLEQRLTPEEINELLKPIPSFGPNSFFSPPEGFGSVAEDSVVMKTVRLLKTSHFENFCRVVNESRKRSPYPSELMMRFSRFNPIQGLNAHHLEVLRTPILRPVIWGPLTDWSREQLVIYQVKITQLFATLFSVVESVVNQLENDAYSYPEIWNAGLCGNHEMRSMFRDYVVLENHLFSWLIPYSSYRMKLRGWSEKCLFNFLNTSQPDLRSDFDFFPPLDEPDKVYANRCPQKLFYASPVWLLHKNTRFKNEPKFVTCAGDRQMVYLMGLLSSIRDHHKSKIPVEIFYLGDNDLSHGNRQRIKKTFPNIQLTNLFNLVDQRILQLRGWLAKPYALLLSEGSQVALLDVDIGFVQSPELVFQQPSFLESGALFFNDRRSISAGWHKIREFIQLVSNFPSLPSLNRRSLNHKNVLEQESGIVAVDKNQRFLGILGVTKLMDKFLREFIHGNGLGIYDGDKEFFFVGFEMMRQEFEFSRWFPGNLGYFVPENGTTCGRMLHFTDLGEPFWWNGGFKDGEDDGERVNNLPAIADSNLTHYDDGGFIGEMQLPRWSHQEWLHVCVSSSARGPRPLKPIWQENIIAAFHAFKKSCVAVDGCIA